MPLSKEKLESLIARTRDIVVATDSEGNVAYYNDGAKHSLGYTSEEILGNSVARLYPDIDEAKNVMRAMRDPAHDGRDPIRAIRDVEQIACLLDGWSRLHEHRARDPGPLDQGREVVGTEVAIEHGVVLPEPAVVISRGRPEVLMRIDHATPPMGARGSSSRAAWRSR